MAMISERRPEVTRAAELPPVKEALRQAGLDPAKLSPIERNYFDIALPRLMAGWKAAGKQVELETARWLETQVAQKQEFLRSNNASPAELRNAQADLRHVHERVLALEKSGLVATKTERFPHGMMQRQVDELKKMGVDDPYKSTWEQRNIAGIRSLYANPFTTREGREAELAQQRKRDALLKEQVAQLGPKKENPFTDEYRMRNMANVQKGIMDNQMYRDALADQNSRFPKNRRTATNLISDAMARVQNPQAELGLVTSSYARAVNDYSRLLKIFSRDRELGEGRKERMVAGLVAQEMEMRIAMAAVVPRSVVAQAKVRPREAEAASKLAIGELPGLEAELMASENYRAALADYNRRFPDNKKTARDLLSDAAAIAAGRKADVGPKGSPYAIAVTGYVIVFEEYAKDRKLGSTPDERILAGIRSAESGPALAQERPRPREREAATVHRYRFTVAGLGSEEKSMTYEFSSANAIDSRALLHALDASSPEEARSNLSALGVIGLTARAVAEMREGVQDPLARTGLAEVKARKGPKS